MIIEHTFKPGDLVFYHNNSLLAKAIRFFETSNKERESGEITWANHVGMMVGAGNVIEALWKVKKHNILDSIKDGEAIVYRRVNPNGSCKFDMYEQSRMAVEADSYVGKTYGWWKLAFNLGDYWVNHFLNTDNVSVFRRLQVKKDRPICHYLAGLILKSVNYLVGGKEPNNLDPDEMMDIIKADDEWVPIWSGKNGVGKWCV